MFFSVILPTFNSSSFIDKALQSLMSQTYRKFEVIASDDGSKDNTVKILKKYKKLFKKKKINLIIIENSHFGPGYARNKAIEKSKYEWLAFLDSDDVWHKDKLLKVLKKKNKNQKINCIIHNEIYINRNKKKIYYDYTNMFSNNKSIFEQLFYQNFLSPTSTCIKKSLVEKHKMFDASLLNGQDYDLWLKIGDNFNLYFLSEYLGSYHERNDNITSIPYKKKIKNLLKILKKNKGNVNKLFYYYKFFRLMINREWFK